MIAVQVAIVVASTVWLLRAPDGSASSYAAAVALLVATLSTPLTGWLF